MDTHAQQIIDAAIKLPADQRVELVHAVLASIPSKEARDGSAHADSEVANAWAEEIERRREDVKSGRVELIPKSDAIPGPADDA